MSIVKNTEQFNREYRKCKKEGTSFVVIETHGRKAQLQYDMWPINYDLSPEAIREIELLFEKLVQNPSTKGIITYSANKTIGYIDNILFTLAEEALPKLANIINDEKNWVPIQF